MRHRLVVLAFGLAVAVSCAERAVGPAEKAATPAERCEVDEPDSFGVPVSVTDRD